MNCLNNDYSLSAVDAEYQSLGVPGVQSLYSQYPDLPGHLVRTTDPLVWDDFQLQEQDFFKKPAPQQRAQAIPAAWGKLYVNFRCPLNRWDIRKRNKAGWSQNEIISERDLTKNFPPPFSPWWRGTRWRWNSFKILIKFPWIPIWTAQRQNSTSYRFLCSSNFRFTTRTISMVSWERQIVCLTWPKIPTGWQRLVLRPL